MRKISKRAKLYLANGICFCSLAGMYIYCSIMLMSVSLFLLVLLMCGFTLWRKRKKTRKQNDGTMGMSKKRAENIFCALFAFFAPLAGV